MSGKSLKNKIFIEALGKCPQNISSFLLANTLVNAIWNHYVLAIAFLNPGMAFNSFFSPWAYNLHSQARYSLLWVRWVLPTRVIVKKR